LCYNINFENLLFFTQVIEIHLVHIIFIESLVLNEKYLIFNIHITNVQEIFLSFMQIIQKFHLNQFYLNIKNYHFFLFL